MKKILYSIEISRYRDTEKRNPMNNITTPRFSLNPLNHPKPRFLSYSVMPIFLSLLAGFFILTACEEETTSPKKDSPPTITAIENQTVQAGGSSITVNISATDPDGQTPTLSYSPILPYATLTTTGEGTADLLFEPERNVSPGETTITITASSGELTATEEFTLTVTDPKDSPPTITAIEDQTVQAGGSSITVNISTSDPDGEIPTLSYSPILPYATLTTNDNGTADLLFAPDRIVPPGTTTITITASSGELTDTEIFTLTITPPDNPPSIDTINNVSVQAGGSSIAVNISAFDPDGEIPTLSYSPELLYATFTDNRNGTATLVFNPGSEVDPGDTNITITANSAGLTDTEIFTLTITALAVDNPPTIDTITNISVEVGASLTVNISAFDPDGEIPTLSYSPELLYATFTDNRNGTATLVFNPGPEVDPGVTNITITANSAGLTDTEIFTLTITPSDSPPSINPINDVFVQVDTSLTVNITASDPDDGQTPSLAYSPILPYATLTTNDNGTATLVFNPGLEVPLGDTNITITASSGELTDIEQFTLTITNTAVDNPPTINPINDVSVQAGGSSITVNITATDPDGEIPTLSYSPELLYATFTNRGNGTATLVFNPGPEVDPGDTNIIITASSGELTNMEQFTLTITPPDRNPVIDSIIPNPVTVRAGETNRVTVTASDPDAGETPTFSLDGTQPTFVTIVDNRNGSATITIRPELGEPPDTNTINVVATSGDKATTNDFILIIGSAVDGDGDGVLDIDDVDDDNDGLIEINSLDDLHNIRYNLAGTSYKTSADDPDNMNGAPGSGLKGYELTRDLDFNDPTSYASGMVNTAWTMGSGWLPIGDNITRFTGILEGNGHKITNLMIRRNTRYVGLFGYIGTTGQVRNLGIENGVADYTGNVTSLNTIGLLAGLSEGTIIAVHTSGIADGGNGNFDFVGGLVGFNEGTITACHATGNANGGDGSGRVGGLVGNNSGTITASYATGNANGGDGNDNVGGLVGVNNSGGTITACYATGNANGGDGNDNVDGLVGNNSGTITACYGFGMVTGKEIAGVDRSGDAFDSTTVGSASALTMANSSTREENRWSARVWDFGTDSQVPVLKWITGYNRRGTTEAERYPCDVALLPAGRECGDIIPGQGR